METVYDAEKVRVKKKGTKWAVIAVILFIALIILGNSFVITMPNEYTLIKQFGKVSYIIEEPGISMKAPIIQTADKLPKELLLYDLAPSDVITMDKKTMISDCYVLWEITDPKLFVQSVVRVSYAESLINTNVYNSMKNVISSLEQTEVISSRDGALNKLIMEDIGTDMDKYGIMISTIEIKRLDLPSDNKNSVYERMISERNNIAASYTAEGEAEATKIRNKTDYEITISLSEAEAQAAKLRAEGEAEYMRILSEVYSDSSRSDFYTFVLSLDAAKASLTGENKTLFITKDSPLASVFYNIK